MYYVAIHERDLLGVVALVELEGALPGPCGCHNYSIFVY